MNIVTFNEHFAVVASREGKARYERACVSPLFDYTAIRTHNMDAIDKMMQSEIDYDEEGDAGARFKMPFPIFRGEFHLRNFAKEKPIARYNIMVFSDQARCYFRMVGYTGDKISSAEFRDIRRRVYCLELMWNGNFEITHWSERHKEWRKVIDANIKTLDSKSPGFQIYSQLIGSLIAFAFDVMSPTTHMASVEPANGDGRTVQWVKARTHFTLIHHGHPANKASVQHGARVAGDLEGEITRMAHSRRAHEKTLRHPRYTYARGKTIKVRACWVGPKEWQDEGGKQIYKILEPSQWQPGDE